jgi:hypothetical protein
MKEPGMIVFGSTKPGHRHPEARAERASKDGQHGWWPFILRDARSALLRMTTGRGAPDELEPDGVRFSRAVSPSSSRNGFAVVAGGASGASLEGWAAGWWPFILRDARSALLGMTGST